MNKEDNSALVTNLRSAGGVSLQKDWVMMHSIYYNLLRETVQENWTRQLPSQQGNRSGHRRGKPLLDFNGRLPPPPKQ